MIKQANEENSCKYNKYFQEFKGNREQKRNGMENKNQDQMELLMMKVKYVK